ncbi:MAG: glycosyltransferase family 2 protein [Chlamydiae bacterium CG10_big_fil_rev_8_21_14_0_10_42_34]|nr:MAG: glycosyltransferase family 2 protein [Chlamydiae bacterium CG10_big_fil_rev_8_21_14_0_10_42_34]
MPIFNKITVCILTKNAESTIEETLDSTHLFSEVLILDNGSTDATLAIASKYPNVVIHKAPFIGFGPLRNRLAELATNDWILALDSDEIVSPPLSQELDQLTLDPHFTYNFPRHNFYDGKQVRGCGWDKEYVARLYNRNATRFSDALVHESLITLKPLTLQYPLLHTPYRSTTEFLAKMQHYSTLFAEQHRGKKSSSFSKALLHGIYAFIRSYFFKKGIFCGKRGFIISLYNANTTFYKYLKLYEVNRNG